MIIPFASAIDLTYRNMPSYRLYQSFCQDVLPLHGSNIRSLRLAGNQQLYFIQPQLHRLTNLQSLTLIGERSYDINQFVIEKQFLIDILSTSSCLSELIIFPAKQNVLHTIASHPSPNLSTLTLLFYNDIPNFTLTASLLVIKRLYINLWSLKAVKQLLRILPSIEQLYLSLLRFKDSTNCHLIEVPPKLTKLHLEINGFFYSRYGPRSDYIHQFLNAFKDCIYSLDLIFINALREFSIYNRFQSLTKDFVRLQSFQYYLQTQYQPHFPHLFSNVEQLQNSTYILYTLFLNAFKDCIYSLDLIFINALREFSIYNRFQSLTKDFVRLQSFQYYLQTQYQPHFPHLFSNVEQLQNSTYILYTLPRLQPFDTVSNRTSVYHDMDYNPNQTFVYNNKCPLVSHYFGDGSLLTPTLDEQFELVNVHQIKIWGVRNIRSSLSELFTRVIMKSSSLTDMHIGEPANVCIQILHNVSVRQRKQIIYLDLYYYSYFDWRKSVSVLSDMLPNLKILGLTLRSHRIHLKRFHVASIIEDLRMYCRTLSVLMLELRKSDEEFKSNFKRIKTELYELSVRTMETRPLCYTKNDDSDSLLIWL
ncbi:unnamed protein product [Adineta ricciae]|uniref:Uncharacterized protein n=1 Tax=Adineta ricciae TaxID=249248 RepID=A0A814KMX8_ADIRI|nr:unnamed protein product [Adineta ricciae]